VSSGTAADPRSDLVLLRAHADGDPDAFGEVVRRHRDRMWAVALRTLGDREEAADAVQDALVSAFRASRGSSAGDGGPPSAAFRGEAAVTTWLHRIVVNACLDRVRRAKVRPTDPWPERDLPARGPDPLAQRELALDLDAALATLPAEQRAALVLVDMYGWSVDDAAQVLDCAPGTVKSRCSRGRARLLRALRAAEAREAAEAAGNRGGTDGVPPSSTVATEGGEQS
jgi:RNA polymerase sigma-70 factor, ECF subfamily